MCEVMYIASWRVIGRLETSDGCGIVLGYDPNSPTPYVTWVYFGDNFGSGNYFDNRDDALKDFMERAGYEF